MKKIIYKPAIKRFVYSSGDFCLESVSSFYLSSCIFLIPLSKPIKLVGLTNKTEENFISSLLYIVRAILKLTAAEDYFKVMLYWKKANYSL